MDMNRRDAAHCERIVREHARTFTLASYFLPTPKRRATFALYAFCRVADDMVDRAIATCDSSIERQLADYERQLTATLAGRPTGPIFRELHWVIDHYAIPADVLLELVAGVARDLKPVRYRSWVELASYCEGVASTVGEMCTYVFGVPSGPAALGRALRYARTLGVAMQLTNILRDVGEDARQGRCYLPDEDLALFGLDSKAVLAGRDVERHPNWEGLMRFEIGRARSLYESAAPGISLLHADSRRCARACATGYAGILGAIEANGYDTVSRRARLGSWARASIVWGAWRGRADPADGIETSEHEPCTEWERWRRPGHDMVKWA
jgi:phytoene synthase